MCAQALIRLAVKGDMEALKDLIKHYIQPVYSFAYRFLQNRQDAEDATQEIFVKVWKNLGKFDLDKKFRTWLFEITKNACLDILRKRKTLNFAAFETEENKNSLTEKLIEDEPSPAELASQTALKQLLDRATGKLSPAYQQVLSLYYKDELNFREIARSLNSPINTIKSRHRRALVLLKRLLGEM